MNELLCTYMYMFEFEWNEKTKMLHCFRGTIYNEKIYNKSHRHTYQKTIFSYRFLEHFKITPTTAPCRQFPLSWKTIRLCLARKNFKRFLTSHMVLIPLPHRHIELCCTAQTIQYPLTKISPLHTFYILAQEPFVRSRVERSYRFLLQCRSDSIPLQ